MIESQIPPLNPKRIMEAACSSKVGCLDISIVWQFDGCPFSNFSRSVGIGIVSKTAVLTDKFGLGFSIWFRNKMAFRTGQRRICRINRNYVYARKFSLVFYFASQILKTPIIKSVSLRFSNRYPKPDFFQIFQWSRSLRVFSFSTRRLELDFWRKSSLKSRITRFKLLLWLN